MNLINTQIQKEFDYFKNSPIIKKRNTCLNVNSESKMTDSIIPTKKPLKYFNFQTKNILEGVQDIEFQNKAKKINSIKQIIKSSGSCEKMNMKRTILEKFNYENSDSDSKSNVLSYKKTYSITKSKRKKKTYKEDKIINESFVKLKTKKSAGIFTSEVNAQKLKQSLNIKFIEDSCFLNFYNSDLFQNMKYLNENNSYPIDIKHIYSSNSSSYLKRKNAKTNNTQYNMFQMNNRNIHEERSIVINRSKEKNIMLKYPTYNVNLKKIQKDNNQNLISPMNNNESLLWAKSLSYNPKTKIEVKSKPKVQIKLPKIRKINKINNNKVQSNIELIKQKEQTFELSPKHRKSLLSYQQPKEINKIIDKIMISLTDLKENPKDKIQHKNKPKNYLNFLKKMKKDKPAKTVKEVTITPFETNSIIPHKNKKQNDLLEENNFKRRKSKAEKVRRTSKLTKEKEVKNDLNPNNGDFLSNFQNMFKNKLEEEMDLQYEI